MEGRISTLTPSLVSRIDGRTSALPQPASSEATVCRTFRLSARAESVHKSAFDCRYRLGQLLPPSRVVLMDFVMMEAAGDAKVRCNRAISLDAVQRAEAGIQDYVRGPDFANLDAQETYLNSPEFRFCWLPAAHMTEIWATSAVSGCRAHFDRQEVPPTANLNLIRCVRYHARCPPVLS